MAYSAVPTTHITGYQLVQASGTTGLTLTVVNAAYYVIIPLTTLASLTAEEANGSTGDIRKIWKALCELITTRWAAIAIADRPQKVNASALSIPTGADTVRTIHTMAFDQTVTAVDVSDEA